jgi:hypothetical protein
VEFDLGIPAEALISLIVAVAGAALMLAFHFRRPLER